MTEQTLKRKFHPKFVRKVWLSFLPQFFACTAILGIIPYAIFTILEAFNIKIPLLPWLKLIANLLTVCFGSYYAIQNAMNKYIESFSTTK